MFCIEPWWTVRILWRSWSQSRGRTRSRQTQGWASVCGQACGTRPASLRPKSLAVVKTEKTDQHWLIASQSLKKILIEPLFTRQMSIECRRIRPASYSLPSPWPWPERFPRSTCAARPAPGSCSGCWWSAAAPSSPSWSSQCLREWTSGWTRCVGAGTPPVLGSPLAVLHRTKKGSGGKC